MLSAASGPLLSPVTPGSRRRSSRGSSAATGEPPRRSASARPHRAARRFVKGRRRLPMTWPSDWFSNTIQMTWPVGGRRTGPGAAGAPDRGRNRRRRRALRGHVPSASGPPASRPGRCPRRRRRRPARRRATSAPGCREPVALARAPMLPATRAAVHRDPPELASATPLSSSSRPVRAAGGVPTHRQADRRKPRTPPRGSPDAAGCRPA